MLSKYIIYGLVDPRDNRLRYIGRSSSRLQRPKQKHSAHCSSWMKNLEDDGLKPEIIVIEEVQQQKLLNEAEIFWIEYFRYIGASLTNMTAGGEGLTDPSRETREKLRAAKLGKKRGPRSEKDKKAISDGNKGLKRSEQARKNISVANFGRVQSQAEKDKRAESNRGQKRTLETRQNIVNSLGQKILCLTDRLKFPSIQSAAKHYGISSYGIRRALVLGKTMRNGLKFAKVTADVV